MRFNWIRFLWIMAKLHVTDPTISILGATDHLYENLERWTDYEKELWEALDIEAARTAIASVGDALGTSVTQTAGGIFRADMNNPEALAAREAEYKQRFANPFVAASLGYIDDVILPHTTRRRITRALKSLKHKQLSNPWRKHDNIPL